MSRIIPPARVLVADPPWKFGDRLPPSGGAMGKAGRGAASKYDVMGLEEIKALELPALAPDAVLFVWRVSAMVEEAYAVCRAWGFVPKSEVVWVKTTRAVAIGGSPCLAFGMGRYVRGAHETCVIAVRGRPSACLPQVRNARSVFFAPRGEHSAKPDAFYALVERMYGGPYVELFARRRRAGWLTLGTGLA